MLPTSPCQLHARLLHITLNTLFLLQVIFAQSGKEFVVGFLENRALTRYPKPRIYLTTQSLQEVEVTIRIPRMAREVRILTLWAYDDVVVKVSSGQPVVHQLDYDLHMLDVGIEDKGVLITATEEISVQCASMNDKSSDAFTALPVSLLGTEHYAITYIYKGESMLTHGPAQIGIIAAYPKTHIQIIFPSDQITVYFPGYSVTHSGRQISLTLERYQTYQLQSYDDLTGTRILSSSPVTVLSGTLWTSVGVQFLGDHLVEQLSPITRWGKFFVTTPLATRSSGDIFRMLASSNSTSVNVTSSLAQTSRTHHLDEGMFRDLEVASTDHWIIQASHPIQLAQFSKSFDADGNRDSDPFMVLVPPLAVAPSTVSFSTVTNLDWLDDFSHFINIVMDTCDVESLTNDTTFLDEKDYHKQWTRIPGTSLSSATLNLTSGQHVLSRHTGVSFSAIVYGFKLQESYGFPLMLISDELSPSIPVNLTCELYPESEVFTELTTTEPPDDQTLSSVSVTSSSNITLEDKLGDNETNITLLPYISVNQQLKNTSEDGVYHRSTVSTVLVTQPPNSSHVFIKGSTKENEQKYNSSNSKEEYTEAVNISLDMSLSVTKQSDMIEGNATEGNLMFSDIDQGGNNAITKSVLFSNISGDASYGGVTVPGEGTRDNTSKEYDESDGVTENNNTRDAVTRPSTERHLPTTRTELAFDDETVLLSNQTESPDYEEVGTNVTGKGQVTKVFGEGEQTDSGLGTQMPLDVTNVIGSPDPAQTLDPLDVVNTNQNYEDGIYNTRSNITVDDALVTQDMLNTGVVNLNNATHDVVSPEVNTMSMVSNGMQQHLDNTTGRAFNVNTSERFDINNTDNPQKQNKDMITLVYSNNSDITEDPLSNNVPNVTSANSTMIGSLVDLNSTKNMNHIDDRTQDVNSTDIFLNTGITNDPGNYSGVSHDIPQEDEQHTVTSSTLYDDSKFNNGTSTISLQDNNTTNDEIVVGGTDSFTDLDNNTMSMIPEALEVTGVWETADPFTQTPSMHTIGDVFKEIETVPDSDLVTSRTPITSTSDGTQTSTQGATTYSSSQLGASFTSLKSSTFSQTVSSSSLDDASAWTTIVNSLHTDSVKDHSTAHPVTYPTDTYTTTQYERTFKTTIFWRVIQNCTDSCITPSASSSQENGGFNKMLIIIPVAVIAGVLSLCLCYCCLTCSCQNLRAWMKKRSKCCGRCYQVLCFRLCRPPDTIPYVEQVFNTASYPKKFIETKNTTYTDPLVLKSPNGSTGELDDVNDNYTACSSLSGSHGETDCTDSHMSSQSSNSTRHQIEAEITGKQSTTRRKRHHTMEVIQHWNARNSVGPGGGVSTFVNRSRPPSGRTTTSPGPSVSARDGLTNVDVSDTAITPEDAPNVHTTRRTYTATTQTQPLPPFTDYMEQPDDCYIDDRDTAMIINVKPTTEWHFKAPLPPIAPCRPDNLVSNRPYEPNYRPEGKPPKHPKTHTSYR